MKIKLEYPYLNFNGYLVAAKDGRKTLCLVDKETKKKTSTSFARYLMSVKMGRFLLKTEHVDHRDEDKTNDDIDNFQILTIKENNEKNIKSLGKTRKMVRMVCPECGLEFIRPHNNSHLSKKGFYSTCGKICSWKHNSKRLNREQLCFIGQNQILEIYRDQR